MKRKQTDRELLQEVEGIGPKRSEALVSRFGSGREVERAATSAFGRVAETDGISKDTAQDMFSRMNDAGVREDLKDRSRSNNEVRGVPQPTDIGREADGEYARPETAPDVTPAPVARNNESGKFGIDPFDLTTGGVGESVELFGGGSSEAMDGGGGALDTPNNSETPAGVARREGERKAAQSDRDTAGLRLLDSRVRAARGDELDTSDAKYGAEEKEQLNNLFK